MEPAQDWCARIKLAIGEEAAVVMGLLRLVVIGLLWLIPFVAIAQQPPPQPLLKMAELAGRTRAISKRRAQKA